MLLNAFLSSTLEMRSNSKKGRRKRNPLPSPASKRVKGMKTIASDNDDSQMSGPSPGLHRPDSKLSMDSTVSFVTAYDESDSDGNTTVASMQNSTISFSGGIIIGHSGKLSFDCQKMAKNLTFLAILLKKMTIFVNFFEKNVKFLAIF